MTSPTSLALDAENNDLFLDASGQLARNVGTKAVLAQGIASRIRTMLGEWYQDPSIGIDYLDQVLVKSPDLPTLQRYFAGQIAKVSGVKTVLNVSVTLLGAERTLQVSFEVVAEDGTPVSGEV